VTDQTLETNMRTILALLGFELCLATLLFGAAGRIDLPWFWALLAIHFVCIGAALLRMDKDLKRERLRPGAGAIDRGFRPILMLFLLVHLLVAGLDAGRFGWSPSFPPAVHAIGLALYTAGLLLSLGAMQANPFFSSVVRLQTDRGHRLVTAGPYRWLRHPGYAGMLIAVFAECFVFGSLWAMLPALAFAATVARRTALEDRFLRDRLSGYAEYALSVRYRLAPCLW
jgi:protein-S-isoprenylcysteine O-methyltransferase Ste14